MTAMSAIRPSQECAKAIALLYQFELEAAQQALARNDVESLHDFRVAMRRLWVAVENYAGESASTRKVQTSLRKLIKRSNRVRDSEVMLLWLQGVKSQLDDTALAGAICWQRSLPHLPHANTHFLQKNSIRLERLTPRVMKLPLRQAFAAMPFSLAAAQRLAMHLSVIQKLLQQEAAVDALHQLRLEAKTLRYLLLPFRASVSACSDAEKQLHQLQDQLGLWHDSVMRRESLTRLLARRVTHLPGKVTRARRSAKSVEVNMLLPELTGLITIARINGHDEQQLLEAIISGPLHRGGEQLVASLEHAITTLRHLSAE